MPHQPKPHQPKSITQRLIWPNWAIFFALPKLYGKTTSAFLLLFLLLAFFVVQLISVVLALPFLPDELATSHVDIFTKFLMAADNGTTLAVSVVFNAIFLIGLCWLTIKAKGGDVGHFLSLNHLPKWRWVGMFVSVLMVFVLISETLSQWLGIDALEFMRPLYDSANPKWLLILSVTVLAPIYEEVLFRGVMWSLVAQQFAKPVHAFCTASLVSSVLFAVVHLQYDAYGMVTIFMLALLFSLARVMSASLWLPILLHICNNSLSMYQLTYSL